MLNRGEPPWHWLVLASVNEADVNGWPLTPVIVAYADAFVSVAHGLARCSTPPLTVAFGHPVSWGSKTCGTSAAAAVPASAMAATLAAMMISLLTDPPLLLLQQCARVA